MAQNKDKLNTIQEEEGSCLSEAQDTLQRWTGYCTELYIVEGLTRWGRMLNQHRTTESCRNSLKLL